MHWHIKENSFHLNSLPYYWRKSNSPNESLDGIPKTMPMNATIDNEYSMLKYIPAKKDWDAIEHSYATDNTIGFLYEGSSQLETYGSSVNKFFLKLATHNNIKNILEIGCGGGLTLNMFKNKGYNVLGIDPSEYSLKACKELKIDIIQNVFDSNFSGFSPDLIICNDVFEHILDPVKFSKDVYNILNNKGVFGIATTSSELAISLGDISMMQHQHVNMFNKTSIYKILRKAGFESISIDKSSYGDTFHIKAVKEPSLCKTNSLDNSKSDEFTEYLEKVKSNLINFKKLYETYSHDLGFYVPIRCFPYLSSVGDFGNCRIFDGNKSWENLYIDGYGQPIENLSNKSSFDLPKYFFIGSLSFYNPIKNALIQKGILEENIFSLSDLIHKNERY